MTTLQALLEQWEARSKDALPTDAMLINKHIRELRTALAQQGEPAANIPHTLAGFIGAFESETGHPPTKQEIWNGAIRSFRDLNAAAPAPQPAQEQVGINGLTEAETSATMSVRGLSKVPQPAQCEQVDCEACKRKDSLLEMSLATIDRLRDAPGVFVDRSDAVNLARNIIENDSDDITRGGVVVLCNAVMRMDAALQSAQPVAAVPPLDANWYVLDNIGMATLCKDREDALEVAAGAFVLSPRNGPYRAVQMVALDDALVAALTDHIPDTGEMVPLTDDEVLTIAHRKATRYTHAVAPGQVTYGFSVVHLLDFARAIEGTT